MSIPDTKSQKVTSISYKLSSVAHRPCLLVNCGDLLLYRYLYYSDNTFFNLFNCSG